MKRLRVLYQRKVRHSIGADYWIADCWKKGFNYFNIEFLEFFGNLDLEFLKFNYDIIMMDVSVMNSEDFSVLEKISQKGTKVCIWIHWPLAESCNQISQLVKQSHWVHLWHGEREPDCMGEFFLDTGFTYVNLPQAASHLDHFPVPMKDNEESYDIVFLGAKLPQKKWFNHLIEHKLKKNYRVGLFGPRWSLEDNVKRLLSGVSSRARLYKMSEFINSTRIKVPLAMEKYLYSSSKISINFHEHSEKNYNNHSIVNQRTFKICASGGFQIVDKVPGIFRHFRETDLVALELDLDLWTSNIDYYLNNIKERDTIAASGYYTAKNNHYSYHRVQKLCTLLGLSI